MSVNNDDAYYILYFTVYNLFCIDKIFVLYLFFFIEIIFIKLYIILQIILFLYYNKVLYAL